MFSGITGLVSIDENGDRNADYSLLDMNKETGLFEVRSLEPPDSNSLQILKVYRFLLYIDAYSCQIVI